MHFKVAGPYLNQSPVCAPILRALPEWFGIEAALLEYEREVDHLPTFLAKADGHVVGFLSVKQHYPHAAEIFVMGVVPESHGRGIGRQLVGQAEAWLKSLGIEYLQVKTLGPSNPDEGYAGTRAFYKTVGFRPLEEFRQIWDENNPCLVLVKRL